MKKIIFFVICFFVMSNTSFALTMTCPNVASPGEVMKIHVEEENYNGIKVKYKFDSLFVYRDLSLNSPWKSYYDGVDGFSVGNVVNQDKLSMDIDIKVGMDAVINNKYTLKLVDIEGNDADYKNVDLDSLSCEVRILSDVNTLDSLVVENVNLTPKFDKNVTSYEGVTSSDRIVIDALVSDSDVTIDGDIGEQRLSLGVNTFVIKVTSARGNVREYKVYITRTIDKKSSDVTLRSLTLSVGELDFKKDTFLYLVDVSHDVSYVDVVATPNDSKAKVEVVKPLELMVGENTINVIVTAEDGTTATYVIVVNRIDKLSGDATIRDLNIKNYYINFNSDIYEYDLEIDNEDKLDIEVILNDDKAKYTIEGNNNLVNNSVIKIVVEAETGDIKTYSISIRKSSNNNSNSINSYIRFIPLVGFIVLILCVLILKILKRKFTK